MWDWFVSFLTQALSYIASFVGDWGLAIIVITAILRLITTPLTLKSTVSSARMQALQPKLKEIQEKHQDDPQRMNEEMKRFYAENKFNPLGGCLPLLIQMPIFFALFSVLKDHVAEGATFLNILPSLKMSVAEMIGHTGVLGAWVYILFDIMFALLTFIPIYLNQRNSEGQQSTLMMGLIMGAMMLWFGWGVPSGVLLYYNTSALWGAIQQIFVTRKITEQIKAEALAKMGTEPVKVDVVRKERSARPRKKS